MSLTQGHKIGACSLVRRLGAGVFGEVWLAKHLDLGIDRAMNIPRRAHSPARRAPLDLRAEYAHVHYGFSG